LPKICPFVADCFSYLDIKLAARDLNSSPPPTPEPREKKKTNKHANIELEGTHVQEQQSGAYSAYIAQIRHLIYTDFRLIMHAHIPFFFVYFLKEKIKLLTK
jgi:hypothetical protein